MSDVPTPRRSGRPALDERDPSVAVNVRLPSKWYDDTYARARRERVSVPERIRRDMRESEKEKFVVEDRIASGVWNRPRP